MKRGFYTLVIMMVIWVGTLSMDSFQPKLMSRRSLAPSPSRVSMLHSGLIAGVPIEKINGHAALFAQRSIEGEETLSETINAYVQAGVELKGFELNTFIDLLRNIDRGASASTERVTSSSSPSTRLGNWEGAGGAGNVARTRDALAAATGKSGTELEVAVVEGGQSVNWYAFTNLTHPSGWNFSLKSLPTYRPLQCGVYRHYRIVLGDR